MPIAFDSPLADRLTGLDLEALTDFMEELAAEIKLHAQQGATDDRWRDAQALKVGEEVGEFLGAFNRWNGFSRRAGDIQDVGEELADVIISGLLMFSLLHLDAESFILEKLEKVTSRGYVNK